MDVIDLRIKIRFSLIYNGHRIESSLNFKIDIYPVEENRIWALVKKCSIWLKSFWIFPRLWQFHFGFTLVKLDL